jgi:hypothetical protein
MVLPTVRQVQVKARLVIVAVSAFLQSSHTRICRSIAKHYEMPLFVQANRHVADLLGLSRSQPIQAHLQLHVNSTWLTVGKAKAKPNA